MLNDLTADSKGLIGYQVLHTTLLEYIVGQLRSELPDSVFVLDTPEGLIEKPMNNSHIPNQWY